MVRSVCFFTHLTQATDVINCQVTAAKHLVSDCKLPIIVVSHLSDPFESAMSNFWPACDGLCEKSLVVHICFKLTSLSRISLSSVIYDNQHFLQHEI